MRFQNKKAIMETNLADWERKIILENFEWEQNLSEIGKLIMDIHRRK